MSTKTRKPSRPSKKEFAAARHALEQATLAIYSSGADGALLSRLVSRICSGMDEGDRFYNASDDTWWEWHSGHLYSSAPPDGYSKTGTSCVLCKRNFPIRRSDGMHYGSAERGRIPETACTDVKAKKAKKR